MPTSFLQYLLCYAAELVDAGYAQANVHTEQEPVLWDDYHGVSSPNETCQ